MQKIALNSGERQKSLWTKLIMVKWKFHFVQKKMHLQGEFRKLFGFQKCIWASQVKYLAFIVACMFAIFPFSFSLPVMQRAALVFCAERTLRSLLRHIQGQITMFYRSAPLMIDWIIPTFLWTMKNDIIYRFFVGTLSYYLRIPCNLIETSFGIDPSLMLSRHKSNCWVSQ